MTYGTCERAASPQDLLPAPQAAADPSPPSLHCHSKPDSHPRASSKSHQCLPVAGGLTAAVQQDESSRGGFIFLLPRRKKSGRCGGQFPALTPPTGGCGGDPHVSKQLLCSWACVTPVQGVKHKSHPQPPRQPPRENPPSQLHAEVVRRPSRHSFSTSSYFRVICGCCPGGEWGLGGCRGVLSPRGAWDDSSGMGMGMLLSSPSSQSRRAARPSPRRRDAPPRGSQVRASSPRAPTQRAAVAKRAIHQPELAGEVGDSPASSHPAAPVMDGGRMKPSRSLLPPCSAATEAADATWDALALGSAHGGSHSLLHPTMGLWALWMSSAPLYLTPSLCAPQSSPASAPVPFES